MFPPRTLRFIVPVLSSSLLAAPSLAQNPQPGWRPPPSYSEQQRRSPSISPEPSQEDCGPARLPGGVWQPPPSPECARRQKRDRNTRRPETPESMPRGSSYSLDSLAGAIDMAFVVTDWPRTSDFEAQVQEAILTYADICPNVPLVSIGGAIGIIYAQTPWDEWVAFIEKEGGLEPEVAGVISMRVVLFDRLQYLERNGCPVLE